MVKDDKAPTKIKCDDVIYTFDGCNYTHYEDNECDYLFTELLTDNDDKEFLNAKVEILSEEKGDHGFAYDPLFYVKEYDKTFGELTTDEKNECSHRRKSMEKFAKWYSEKL